MEVQTSSSVWRRVVTMDEQAVPVRKLQSNDGTAIAFEQSGDGPPVILVGSAFNDRSGTAPLAAALAARLTVFNDDRRGRGDSGDTAAYSVAREIQDLDALIAQAGGSSAVFGHSSGATLALHAAAHGLAITKLALYEPPFLVDQSRPRPPADLPKQLAELISAGRRGDAVELYQTKYVGIPEDVVAQLRHAPFRPALEAIAHTLLYDATIIGDLTLPTDLVAKVATPTLVIDGENSMPMLRNAARVLADTLPNGRPCTLAGQSHDISQRQPRQCCWTSSPANHCALRTSSQRSHRSGGASCVSDKIQSRVNTPSLSNSMKRIRLARHSSVGQS